MERKFTLSCCSTVDLPYSYMESRDIPVLFYTYVVDGQTYDDDMGRDPAALPRFYGFLKEGKLPQTSQINVAGYMDFFERLLQQGGDVLHIAFGSGMTASVQNANLAAEVLREKYPERKLVVIDSLCSSLGISPYLDKPTRKLSTGMKQQVKLAMAIATDCPYLILDEPLNGLDPGKRKTSCDAMRSEVARGRSVLISSHLLDDLADLTNSFYFIEAGTLVEKIKSSSQTLKQEYLDTYEGGE